MSGAGVSQADIAAALRQLGLSGRPVCAHVSLRSFGWVDGAAETVVDAFLDACGTLMVPTFSWEAFAVPPPEASAMRPRRNGWDYGARAWEAGSRLVYDAGTERVDADMGAVPRAVLARTGRVRGDHPLASFAAVGPVASRLIRRQTPADPFAPLQALSACNGFVALLGVGLTRMTLLHLAEQRAGRNPLRRWALGPDGEPMLVAVGGCSDGFEALGPAIAPLERRVTVGASRWRVFPAGDALNAAVRAISADPSVTHCGRPCPRCDDAIAGGPILVE